MENHKGIEKIIRSVLDEKFEDVVITSVNVHQDYDEYGDEILSIDLVFDNKAKSLDARKASGLVRHMIPMMRDNGERRFPVLTFIANSELGKKSPEAA